MLPFLVELQVLLSHRYNFREHGTYTLALHNSPASRPGAVAATLVTDLPGNETWVPAVIALASIAGVALLLKLGKIVVMKTMEVCSYACMRACVCVGVRGRAARDPHSCTTGSMYTMCSSPPPFPTER